MTDEHHESGSESQVDQWFIREYAYSATVAGLRGDTAVKAISKHDSGNEFFVLVEPSELEDYDEVDAEDVPGWAREEIEEQFRIRAKKLNLPRKAGGSSE